MLIAFLIHRCFACSTSCAVAGTRNKSNSRTVLAIGDRKVIGSCLRFNRIIAMASRKLSAQAATSRGASKLNISVCVSPMFQGESTTSVAYTTFYRFSFNTSYNSIDILSPTFFARVQRLLHPFQHAGCLTLANPDIGSLLTHILSDKKSYSSSSVSGETLIFSVNVIGDSYN